MMISESYQPSSLIQSNSLNAQYKKNGLSQRRRIRLTDPKIIETPSWGESVSREQHNTYQLTPSVFRVRDKLAQDRSRTEAKKKEKDVRHLQGDQNNIFKQTSNQIISRLSRQDIRLPILDKRRDESQDPENKRIVVRIALDKLKKLPPEEVKKRFLQKYQYPHKE